MPVFKGAMKIARQNLGLIFMYIGIVAAVLCLTISNNAGPKDDSYSAISMKVSFVDEDRSALSHALEEYLSGLHDLKKCENDPITLQEDLYYHRTDFILRIPEGFGTDPDSHPLLVTEVPGSYTGFYLESQIENYLRQIRLYRAAGFSETEAISKTNSAPAPSVSVPEQPGQGHVSLGGFFQFIPYGALCILSFVMGNVLCAFMKAEIRNRIGASAFPYRRTEWELLLAAVIFGILIFVVFLLMGTAFYGSAFWSDSHLSLYLGNMALMILVSMSIAYLISMLSSNQESLTGIINAVTLGMCFLCGVFVPLELLGKGVITAAHFLPFYWYERANLLIAKTPVLSGSQMALFWEYLGIQAAFSVAFLSLGAAVHKKRNI